MPRLTLLFVLSLYLFCACHDRRDVGEMAGLATQALEAFPKRDPNKPIPPKPKPPVIEEKTEVQPDSSMNYGKKLPPVVLVTQANQKPNRAQVVSRAAGRYVHPLIAKTERNAAEGITLGTGLILGGPEKLVIGLGLPKEGYAVYQIGKYDATLEAVQTLDGLNVQLWQASSALGNLEAKIRTSPATLGEDLVALQATSSGPVAVPVTVAGVNVETTLESFDPAQPGHLLTLALPDVEQLHGSVLMDLEGRVTGLVIPRPEGQLAAAVPASILASLRGELTLAKLAEKSDEAPAYVKRGVRLGAQITELLPEDVEKIGPGVPPVATINKVYEGSPAQRAGLQHGDILLEMDDEALGSFEALLKGLEKHPQGEPLSLLVLRNGERAAVIIPDPENR